MRQKQLFRSALLGSLAGLGFALSAAARTVVIDASEIDRAAAIVDDAPRMSWAGYQPWAAGIYYGYCIDLAPGRSMLVHFPITKIPAGQKITSAELITTVIHMGGNDVRFYLWRLLPEWGPGVCHLYRNTRPAKVPWAIPGAHGVATDRAVQPTAIMRLTTIGEQVVNVTEDIELWYTGAAPNNGWMFTVEDIGTFVRLLSPTWPDGAQVWRLRITYEPE